MSKQLLKSTSVVSMMTMISRLLGFVRDMVIAHLFGAGMETDAFFVAFKLPNFMRRLFAEGAFSQAFVPIFAEYKAQRSAAALKTFLSHVLGNLALIVSLTVVVGIMCAPFLIMLFAPGFKHDGLRFHLATHMLRLTFPYLLFISLTACFGAVLNTFKRFAASAFAPVWLNVILIASAFVFYKVFAYPIYGLALGVLFAGIVQCLFLWWHANRQDLAPRMCVSFKDPGVRRVLKLMVPAIFGVSIAQINLFVDTFFASFLPAGSVSWLYYSERLMTFPLGVFAVAVGVVVLPHLSQKKAAADHQAFSSSIDWGLRFLLFIGVPAAIFLIFLSGPMLSTLFQYGVFSARDVLMSSQSLMAYALGVPFLMLIKVLSAGFYANQNIKTPVKIGALAMLTNVVFNMLLIHPFAHAGIALATSIAAMVNAGLLIFFLLKHAFYQPLSGWCVFGVRLFLAGVALGAFLWFACGRVQWWVLQTAVTRAWHLLLLIVVGAVLYLGVLCLLRFPFKPLFFSKN